MRTVIMAVLLGFGASVALAQGTHFNTDTCSKDGIGQLQLEAHSMLSANGHGDFDVTTLTLDQLVKLIELDMSQEVNQDKVDHILGVGAP